MEQKTVLLGVTGSIAAYKMVNVASMLVKLGVDVHVILTQNGAEFITATSFETITGNKCLTDTFDRDFQFDVTHISLAKKADLAVIAPASANVIGKLAHGIADDMLTTTLLACPCPKVYAPAMNTNMYHNPIVQQNMSLLEGYGFEKIPPIQGKLACGDVGEGKMATEETIVHEITTRLFPSKDLEGKRILVTAGATRERLDPVRYITNHSTGKMGYALAEAAQERGAEVVLVSGQTALPPVKGVEMCMVESAQDMFLAVKERDWDIIIKAAAVADYRPVSVSDQKMKKKDSELTLSLERTVDILQYLGEHRQKGQYICGFSMETENMIANSRQKLEKKNIDMIIANNLKQEGAGFGVDTNIVTIITKDSQQDLSILTKKDLAYVILDEIKKNLPH